VRVLRRARRVPPSRPAPPAGEPLLRVGDLRVGFHTRRGILWAVDGVTLELERGRTLGIVGESGSGKTVLSRSIMGLLPRTNVTCEGSVRLSGQELTGLTSDELRALRGSEIAMVFQDPMTSLNPVVRIGRQITESLRFHAGITGGEARQIALQLLREVRIPDPELRIREYAHQLSGGTRQRVSIAVALACGPGLLIADEPTSALDVTVQAQILDLLGREQQERHMAMILITHDLALIAHRADDIAVMYAGQIVEKAPAATLFTAAKMPYTRALLRSLPRLDRTDGSRLEAIDGRPPDLTDPPAGCRFAPRCTVAQGRCHAEAPPLRSDPDGHAYRCWFPLPGDGPVSVGIRGNGAGHSSTSEPARD
jgi:oligopeptide/dipeptide ABC transporter ATP-binding protein